MKEEWKEIPGYDGWYEVSSAGRVRSWRNGKWGRRENPKILKPHPDGSGYRKVKLTLDGKETNHAVSRLVANQFIPNPNSKPQVNHKNGIKTDDRAINLEWCTNGENLKHAYKTGLKTNVGEINPSSTLSEEEVLSIRDEYKNKDVTQYDLAEKYDVHQTIISLIVRKKKWSHI